MFISREQGAVGIQSLPFRVWEPSEGKLVAQDPAGSELVFGIHSKLRVIPSLMSFQPPHTCSKCPFKSSLSSESTLEVTDKIQIKEKVIRRKNVFF